MSERQISLDDALPGMTLAAQLSDAQGSVLLPAGVALSAANLASLRRRGIAECVVVDNDDDDDALDAPDTPDMAAKKKEEEQARRHQRLVRLFRGSAGIGASAVLLQLLLAYRRGD